MAAWLNKWLLLSLFPLMTLRNGGNVPVFHPFHLSTTEINHNASDQTLEISCRIFTDDFESALVKQFGGRADFSNAALKSRMDTLVKNYIISHLQLKVENKNVGLSYVGWEQDHEAIEAYFQVSGIKTMHRLDAVNTLLHNVFTDQMNIMHVIEAGKRKSEKLDYPTAAVTFNF